MQKRTTPSVPMGLTPALTEFLRWVRGELNGMAVSMAAETAKQGVSNAKAAMSEAERGFLSAKLASGSAAHAQETANSGVELAATAKGLAEGAISAAELAQETADIGRAFAVNHPTIGHDAATMDKAGFLSIQDKKRLDKLWLNSGLSD